MKKNAYIPKVLDFNYSKKRQNRAFSVTALLPVVNKVAIKRCFHAIRERPGGLQVVYLPPSQKKSMLSGAATAPSRPPNINLGGGGVRLAVITRIKNVDQIREERDFIFIENEHFCDASVAYPLSEILHIAKLCSKVSISAAYRSCFPPPQKLMLGSLFGAAKNTSEIP